MKPLLFTVLFVCAAAVSPARSATFKLPDGKPVVTLAIPDAWKPEEIARGVRGRTADATVYLSAETTKTEKDMNAIIDGSLATLKEHKVSFDNASKKENKFTINGLPADEMLYEGKSEDGGPTTVSVTFVSLRDGVLVFTYWASTDGEKKHGKEISAIVQSVRALK